MNMNIEQSVIGNHDEMVINDLGTTMSGEDYSLKLKNVSSILVGGNPGSGKTNFLQSLVSMLSHDEVANISVIEGKGGSDWDSFADEITLIRDGGFEMEAVIELLKEKVDVMNSRLSAGMSFWGMTALERELDDTKWEVIIVDETSPLFDTRGMSKAEKEQSAEIGRLLMYIQKIGRSAGMLVIFSSQRPNYDSLPTVIRDHAAIRVCFRVNMASVASHILRDDEGVEMAMNIPRSNTGEAVIIDSNNQLSHVQFSYLSPLS